MGLVFVQRQAWSSLDCENRLGHLALDPFGATRFRSLLPNKKKILNGHLRIEYSEGCIRRGRTSHKVAVPSQGAWAGHQSRFSQALDVGPRSRFSTTQGSTIDDSCDSHDAFDFLKILHDLVELADVFDSNVEDTDGFFVFGGSYLCAVDIHSADSEGLCHVF